MARAAPLSARRPHPRPTSRSRTISDETDAPRRLFAGERLQVTIHGDAPERLFITFDHWKRQKDGFDPRSAESQFSTRGFTHLHLATSHNDWFLNADLADALAAMADFAAGYDKIAGIAFSMGCYGALLVSRAVAFDQLLLVSPHSTYAPDAPPFDDRFTHDMPDLALAAATHKALLASPPAQSECVVVYDSTQDFDAVHARRTAALFDTARRVDLRHGGHPATQVVTKAGRHGVVWRAVLGNGIREGQLIEVHDGLIAKRG